MSMATGPAALPLERLRTFGERAYQHAGLSPDAARTVVDVQLDADLRGVDTHGFQRLPWYVERLLAGENNPRPHLRVEKGTPASVLLDGDNGLGQIVCVRLMELTLAKARTSGLAVGALKNSNDWGCGAYYLMPAAAEGFLAFCTTTSVPTLATYSGLTRVTGNNPMAFAVARRAAPPLVLVMALTPVALGKVLRARAEGESIPASWGFRDREGRMTTDPATALWGVLPAIGDSKGIGLSVMMNILAGVLPGGYHSSAVDVGKRGQFFLVVAPALFGDPDRFHHEIESMIGQITATDLLPNAEEVYLPGELEQRQYEQRVERGAIHYPRSVVAELTALGEKIGVSLGG